MRVNGASTQTDVWPGESLLYALRERSGLPGSKQTLASRVSGSRSVLLDGVLACSCLVLAAQADGHDVVTVEWPAATASSTQCSAASSSTRCGSVRVLHPGLIVAAADSSSGSLRPSDDEIREALSGNLCRCTGYGRILEAVRRRRRDA